MSCTIETVSSYTNLYLQTMQLSSLVVHIFIIPEMYCTAMTSIQNGIRENPYQHKQNCVDN